MNFRQNPVLISALCGSVALITAASCNGDDDAVAPIVNTADALVGNYVTYDTLVHNQLGTDSTTVSSDTGNISKVSATRVQLNGLIRNVCSDTARAEVTEATLVVYNNACRSGLSISRVNDTTLRYSMTESGSGITVRYSGRIEKLR